jgi:hypothetical protein
LAPVHADGGYLVRKRLWDLGPSYDNKGNRLGRNTLFCHVQEMAMPGKEEYHRRIMPCPQRIRSLLSCYAWAGSQT